MARPQIRFEKTILSAGAVLACTIGGLVTAAPAPRPEASFVAAVFPPWWSPQRVFGAATDVGEIVSTGGAPFAIVVHSARANLPARLRSLGAWMVIETSKVGCSPKTGQLQ